MEETSINAEEEQFLAECEVEFADRYTDKDEEFMKIHTAEPRKPPIVDPWYNKPRRNYDWSRQNQAQNQGRRNHNWERRNNERLDRHAGKHHLFQRNIKPY